MYVPVPAGILKQHNFEGIFKILDMTPDLEGAEIIYSN